MFYDDPLREDREIALPKVLLLGNGVNRNFQKDSWDSLLRDIAVEPPADCADEYGKWELKKIEKIDLPMPLKVIYLTGDQVDKRLFDKIRGKGSEKADPDLKSKLYGTLSDDQRQMYLDILDLGFEHIITTNYSYELEQAAMGKELSDYALKKMHRSMRPDHPAESKFLLHTCNVVPYKDLTVHIWHIHGEARLPNSMVIGHYWYANLLSQYAAFFKERRNKYYERQKEGKTMPVESWLDLFVLGDVYTLGFGFDQSELDMWWLLNRKKRENADTGRVHYFSPHENSEKEKLLAVLGAEVINLKMDKPSGKDEENFYAAFYRKSLTEISKRLSEH